MYTTSSRGVVGVMSMGHAGHRGDIHEVQRVGLYRKDIVSGHSTLSTSRPPRGFGLNLKGGLKSLLHLIGR